MDSDKIGHSAEGEGNGHGGDTSVVKSVAVARFPQVQRLSPYSRLDLDTDLRQPPPNWLRNGPTIQVPNSWIKGEPAEISSFGMAAADILDKVDVISASENIKKLLKIPFSNEQVSLAVHRIGKTLLLDKLDLYRHLRNASQGEQQWLKDVFIRLVQSEGATAFQGQHKTTESLRTSNLLSKFLYHSLGSDYNVGEPEESQKPDLPTAIQQVPKLRENEVSQFARQVYWQFEDICMLIGTDLPIFGGGTYPAVSLRLRDAQSPINVLTGLDYWLDNLMCNVPELVMCYHLDGFVKRYELIKTEEIPNLENAQFSQKVVKDIAQNILSFINSNCTKEGHTYWLYKGQDEEVVKLYDLSSLMTKKPDCPWDNPFVVPVATLLYQVAHNMAQTATSAKDRHIIVTLLDKCLALLSQCRDQDPEIVASANYILCQMYMDESREGRRDNTGGDDDTGSDWTGGSNTSSDVDDDFKDENEDEEEHEADEEDEDQQSTSIATSPINITSLREPSNNTWKRKDSERKRSKAKLFNASKEERAQQTLEYVVRGLKAIRSSIPDSVIDSRQSPAHSAIPLSLPPSSPEHTNPTFTTSWAIPLPDKPSSCDLTLDDQATERDSPLYTDQSKSTSHVSHAFGESSNVLDKAQIPDGSKACAIEALHLVDMSLNIAGDDPQCSSSGKLHREEQGDREVGKSGGHSPAKVCSDLVPSSSSEGSGSGRTVAKERHLPPGSWQETFSLRLLEKAYCAYCVLSEIAWKEHRHGKALIRCHLAFKCLGTCKSIASWNNRTVQTLMICGDSHLLLTHDPRSQHLHHEDYQNLTDTDTFILETAAIQQVSNGYDWATEFHMDTEDCLEYSIKCYKVCSERAAGMGTAFKKNVQQKLGNACNELGVYFMNTAANLASIETSLPSPFKQELWKESFRCFDAGIGSFQEVSDSTNVALLNCNMGRLMRLCAQSYSAGGSLGPDGELSSKERHYFVKATECYRRALHTLGSKRCHTELHDSITWELCTTYFNMACLMQDHPPLSASTLTQIEKDILEGMNKALSFCDTEETSSSRQPLYQYRAASIHHRLASMYHNSNRNQSSHMKEKHTRSLSELHYTKAVRCFEELDRPVELLRVQLERVALLEHQFEGQSGSTSRVKTLELALGIMIGCRHIVPQLETMGYNIVPSPSKSTVSQECGRHDPQRTNVPTEAVAMSARSGASSSEPDRARRDEKQERRTSLDGGRPASPGSVPGQKGRDGEGGVGKSETKLEGDDGGRSTSEVEEIKRLLTIFESRLQFVLLHLVKLLGSSKKRCQENLPIYKQAYATSLGRVPQGCAEGDKSNLSQKLNSIHWILESRK